MATYIPLTCAGVLRWVTRNMLVSFALGNAKVPNANDFPSQWNIGLKMH